MSIVQNIKDIEIELENTGAKLIPVSKTKPAELLLEAYNAGHKVFGENYVQELVDKYEQMPKDIEWHMIGHLQSNKVKYIAPFVSLIHSVDSAKLLQEINKQALKNNRIIKCLLQVHIATEDTKSGFDTSEIVAFVTSDVIESLKNVEIIGLMGMSTFTDDKSVVLDEFRELKSIFEMLKAENKNSNAKFVELSMGMSDDWQLAVQEGSTMVRIGSKIFGNRNYTL